MKVWSLTTKEEVSFDCQKLSELLFDILPKTVFSPLLLNHLILAWSCSVMLGFARLPDKEFVAAMQAINRAIQNPVFFTVFFGAPILLPLSAFLHYGLPVSARFWSLLAATLIYLIGTFGITVFGNVSLNNTLDRFDLQAASESELPGKEQILKGVGTI